MADTVFSFPRTSTRLTFSCIRCAERKVKCDRQTPCSACTKHNVDCVFSTLKPPPKKHKRVKVQVLSDRINQYEALLQKHGIDRNELPDIVNHQPSSLPRRTAAATTRLGEIHTKTPLPTEPETSRESEVAHHENDQNGPRFVENSLWRRVDEESHDSENILDHSDSSSNLEDSDGEYGFVVNIRPNIAKRSQLPSSEIRCQLWDDFVENVDPLTKLVHVPTLRPAFQKATSNTKTISRGFEALMFAIFAAAVMSLKDDECQQRFKETRRSMLSRYVRATEAGLSRAKFMATTSFVVLQALVLHLYSVRDIYEPRATWTLTGVAVRIAQSMGLDRDGTVLGLSPFETEIRRRVWWQLKSHDFRTAELCGLAKFRDLDTGNGSTQWPTSINDEDLHPGMADIVAETNKLSDAAFVAFKFEMMNFAASRISMFRKKGKHPSQWNLDTSDNNQVELESAVEELKSSLEMKYLRYCDPSQPLHLVLLLVGRYGMNTVTFLTHHPRRWATMDFVPQSERALVWNGSIKLLEQYNMMQSNPFIKRFAWHAPYFQPLHAFIHVLDTLRAEPLKPDASKVWQLVGSIYENTPEMLSDMKKPIHVAVGNLCLKAHSAREAVMEGNNAYLPPTPNFVLQLRRLREAAMAKRQARSERTNQPAKITVREMQAHQPTSTNNTTEILAMLPQRNATSQPSLATQFDRSTETDPFGLYDGSDSHHLDNMHIDLDYMFPEHNGMDDVSLTPIDWEQWDTWLADSNIMPSSSS